MVCLKFGILRGYGLMDKAFASGAKDWGFESPYLRPFCRPNMEANE